MILTERATKTLQTILSNRMITVEQLVAELGCSKRQINYDLQKINSWLEGHHIPSIQNKKEMGLTVPEEVRNQIFQIIPKITIDYYIPSQSDRQKIIFLQLFMKRNYLSVNHLTDQLKMSRNTVLSYIQLLKEHLQGKGLTLTYNRQEGYGLSGDEISIRALAFKYLSYLIKLPNGWNLLENIYDRQEGKGVFLKTYQTTLQTMNGIENQLNVSFVEEQIKEVTIFLLFLKCRILSGFKCSMDSDIKSIVKESDIYNFSNEILTKLSVPYVDEEVTYISMHLLSVNTNYDTGILNQNKDKEMLTVISHVLDEFEKNACVIFNNRDSLLESLYMHIRPIYYRTLFHISITNPYLDQIKQEFHDLYSLVKKSIHPLEVYLRATISEEEIGYITLHFGGYLKREKISYRRKRCIVICPNGVSTSNMLKNQLNQLIPEVEVIKIVSLRQFYEGVGLDVDFIISTIPVETTKPLIIVSPILTSIDKAKILKEVNFLLYSKNIVSPKVNEIIHVIREYADIHDEPALIHSLTNLLTVNTVKELGRVKPVLNQLLTKDTIQITKQVADWKEAIQLAASPLVKQKKINESYIDAMIANVEKIGPYIVLTPKVAIPHARPEDGVNEVSISLLKIDHPVSFSPGDPEKDVNLVFIIAAIDNDLHLKALSQLSSLLEDDDNVDELIKVDTVQDILEFINKYS